MIFETKYRMQALLAWEKIHEENRTAHAEQETVRDTQETPKHTEIRQPLIILFAALFAWFTRN